MKKSMPCPLQKFTPFCWRKQNAKAAIADGKNEEVRERLLREHP